MVNLYSSPIKSPSNQKGFLYRSYYLGTDSFLLGYNIKIYGSQPNRFLSSVPAVIPTLSTPCCGAEDQ